MLAQTTCGLSEHNSPKKWTFSTGYRYQASFRHYVGTIEQTQRETNHNQIENIYHLVDFGIERQITVRWSVTASVPMLFAHRNQLYAPVGKYSVNAFGDASIGARAWIFKPPTESGDNISVGVGLKLPTGIYNATGLAVQSGKTIRATADQSVQAGDGRVGFSIDVQAYKRLPLQTEIYFAGLYLFNPADTNGVTTNRSAKGEGVMSVTDQYLFRGGFGHAIPKVKGMAASFGGRIEGVPVRDLLGKSNGFRRPGYAIAIDPGLMFVHGLYAISVTTPVAVERNRRRSVADIARGPTVHGDAAFADYTLMMSVSRRF